MKKLLAFVAILTFVGCKELQMLNAAAGGYQAITDGEIAQGLKEALNKGIEKQVVKLTATDGFYKNKAVKILLPDDLKKVEEKLKSVGLGSLTDEGILLLNRAAEDAVKESTPIFVDAIKNMSFSDVRNILMGHDSSATAYLEKTTTKPLYSKFYPVVKNSLGKVGADKTWASIISKYNKLPFVEDINPDLNDHVTNRALAGVFTMITVEEKSIRNDLSFRTSDLLKKVFALQDK